MTDSTKNKNVLNHIAIIPSGNRTWARKNGLPDAEGHRIGAEKLIDMARFVRTLGIHTVSVWGMSTENFSKRPKQEVKNLFKLLKYHINKSAQEAHEEGTRFIHLGRKDRMPKDLAENLIMWEEKTINNKKHTLNLGFDYGGHDELLRAFKKAHNDLVSKKISFDDLTKETEKYNNKYPVYGFKQYLDTKDQKYPFPDLIIRSDGEKRLSGFMPWQTVYSEFYPAPELWPEFTEDTIHTAIKDYQKADRKFGGDIEF